MDKCIICESDFEDAGAVCHNCYMIPEAEVEAQEARIKQLEGVLYAVQYYLWRDKGHHDEMRSAIKEALQEGIHDDCPLDDYVEEEANVD